MQDGFEKQESFRYPFVLAAFNLLDAGATPQTSRPLWVKAEFCAKHLDERQLLAINRTLAAFTDEEFERFVLVQ
jgi:hypothetical protein